MEDNKTNFTNSWVFNQYLTGINTPAVMRRIDRLMVGEQTDEFNLANTAKREFVNMLDRFGALFRISNFPMEDYVKIRGTYIVTVWRIIESEVINFRQRAALPHYASSLEWWAGEISRISEETTDKKYKVTDKYLKKD